MRRADREVTDVDGMIDIIDHCKVCHIALMDGEAKKQYHAGTEPQKNATL